MALAEAGRFDDAAALQQQVVEQLAAGAAPAPPLERARARLATYRRGEAVRAPWRGGA